MVFLQSPWGLGGLKGTFLVIPGRVTPSSINSVQTGSPSQADLQVYRIYQCPNPTTYSWYNFFIAHYIKKLRRMRRDACKSSLKSPIPVHALCADFDISSLRSQKGTSLPVVVRGEEFEQTRYLIHPRTAPRAIMPRGPLRISGLFVRSDFTDNFVLPGNLLIHTGRIFFCFKNTLNCLLGIHRMVCQEEFSEFFRLNYLISLAG